MNEIGRNIGLEYLVFQDRWSLERFHCMSHTDNVWLFCIPSNYAPRDSSCYRQRCTGKTYGVLFKGKAVLYLAVCDVYNTMLDIPNLPPLKKLDGRLHIQLFICT